MTLNDKTFQSLLRQKGTPEPSEVMEDAIMDAIRKNVRSAAQQKHSYMLAWIFFIVGLTLGVLLSTVVIDSNSYILGVNLSDIGLIRNLICIIAILMLFERLYSNAITKNKLDRHLNSDNFSESMSPIR
jgi:hypothetical protein